MTETRTDEQVAEALSEWARQWEAQMELIKRACRDIAEAVKGAWKVIQEAFYGGVPGTEVPEVWEAYAHTLLDQPRPPVGTRAHATAAQDTATDIVRYLTQVARIREEATP